MEERARQRELRNAGVVAARDARQRLASAIEVLDADAQDAPAQRLAAELSTAVGALFGCEIGDASGVLDNLRGASAVLSGVLARLHGPAAGTRMDEAGELVAASLAVLYPVRAGLERDLVEQRAAERARSSRPASKPVARGARGSDRARTFTVRGSSVSAREAPTLGEALAPDTQAELDAVRVLSAQASPTLIDARPPIEVQPVDAPDEAAPPSKPLSVRPLPLVDRKPPPAVETLLRMGTEPPEPSAASAEVPSLFPDGAGDAGLPPLLLYEKRGARPRRRALELVPDGQGELIDAASGEHRAAHDAERRVQERVMLEVDIGLHSATQFYAGLSNDISEGGIFVSTVKPMPVGSELSISFVLPGGHAVTTRGRVAWLSTPRDDDSRPGMGVRFVRLEPQHLAAIEKFLRYRPAMLHEL